MHVNLFMVDDHRLVREGVCALLEKQAGFKVVGQARNGTEAVRLARQLAPHIVLMDLYIPGLTGIEATRLIRTDKTMARAPKVIALSACNDQMAIRRMMRAGASAYVAKCWPFAELCRAIRAVHAGELYCGPATGALTRALAEPQPSNAGKLSQREMQTLLLLADGKSSQDIADTMGISLKTVEWHRSRLRRKLGLSSVAELTRYAIEAGFPG